MPQYAIDVVVSPSAPVVDVTSVGVQGPPGVPGPPGPAGPEGPPGEAEVSGDIAVDSISVGTTPAQSGAVRLANEESITARNGANTADVSLMRVRPWDGIEIGGPAATSAGLTATGSFVGFGVTGGPTSPYTWGVVNTGALQPSADNAFNLGAPAVRVKTVHVGTGVNLKETAAPAAPAADCCNLWVEDNGAGKSRLMVQFATGAPVQIAIQP